MRLPRARFTVRGLMLAVAVVAALIVAPDLDLDQPQGTMLVATIGGTAALAVEKARRDVERARRRGETVGSLRFPGRIIAALPAAALIIAACWSFNHLSYLTRSDFAYWLLDAARPGLDPYEAYLALMQIMPRMTAGMDLVLVWAAFRLWDGRRAARSPGLPVAPVPHDPE